MSLKLEIEYPSLYLNGTTASYVEVYPFSYTLSEFTISFWMKTDDTVKDGTPISMSDGVTHNEILIFNYKNFQIYIENVSRTTNVSANDGVWHNIAVTWRNSDGLVKLYKDGVEAYSGTLKAGAAPDPKNLIIGQEQDSFRGGFDPNQAFLGLIRNVLFYNRFLSGDEIRYNYNNPDNPVTNGLILWLRLDEMGGNIARDLSGYGNHGTIYGATWTREWFDETSRLLSLRHSLAGRELENVSLTLVNAELRPGQRIRLKRGNRIFFEGVVYEARRRHDKNYVSVDATAYSPLILYDRHVVYRLYQTGTKAGDIIRDIASFEQEVIVDADDGPQLLANWEIQNQTALEVMKSVARGTNYWLRMRPVLSYLYFYADDYVNLDAMNNFPTGTQAFTALVLCSATGEGSGTARRAFSWGDAVTNNGQAIGLTTTNKFFAGPDGTPIIDPDPPVYNSPVWLGYRYYGGENGLAQFLRNGVVKASANITPTTTRTRCRVGAYVASSPSYFWYGNVYMILLYNRALSDLDIQKIISDPLNPPTTNLVLWLKFNEGAGNKIYDNSGNNNHGTIYGATWGYEKNPPFSNAKLLEFKPKVIA